MLFVARLLAVLLLAGSAFSQQVSATNGRMTLTAYHSAGWAVCSLRLDGVEYIDSFDHGRCLQSAVSFDWQGEAFNPTEGGSVIDGLMPSPSTTMLYTAQGNGGQMATEVQAAFWSGGLSNHVIRKYLTVGFAGRNITEHRIAFEIPANEMHSAGQFEILTGYMPASFRSFSTFDPATGVLQALSDGPGEQALPVIFCADSAHCMGAFSPLPLVGGGYGRWRFNNFIGACVKWNMVARFAYPAGVYRFRVFTTAGTLAEVEANLQWLFSTQPR